MYGITCKPYTEKSIDKVLDLAEEMCEAQISGVRVNTPGKCCCSLAFSYTLPGSSAPVNSQKQDTRLERPLISPYKSMMIAQSAPSVAGYIQKGANCGSAGT